MLTWPFHSVSWAFNYRTPVLLISAVQFNDSTIEACPKGSCWTGLFLTVFSEVRSYHSGGPTLTSPDMPGTADGWQCLSWAGIVTATWTLISYLWTRQMKRSFAITAGYLSVTFCCLQAAEYTVLLARFTGKCWCWLGLTNHFTSLSPISSSGFGSWPYWASRSCCLITSFASSSSPDPSLALCTNPAAYKSPHYIPAGFSHSCWFRKLTANSSFWSFWVIIRVTKQEMSFWLEATYSRVRPTGIEH